jgi:protein translocase SecG subunit
MITFMLTIHLILAISLVSVILLQKSDGGAVGSSQANNMMSIRAKSNFFTKMTSILAGLFMANSLLMAIIIQGPRRFDLGKPIQESNKIEMKDDKKDSSKKDTELGRPKEEKDSKKESKK